MPIFLPPGRAALAACILLSACAATPGDGPSASASSNAPERAATITAPDPAYGAFLAARYADAIGDPASAAKFYTTALKYVPKKRELLQEGFLASVLAGSPEAARLAPLLPGNALAILVRGDEAALRGDYATAARFFATLPEDQLSMLIKPLLIAWTQLGQGNEQAALNTLGPSFNNDAFGIVYVLNAALIADAAGDTKSAAQLYGAISDASANLRLAEILASWYARQGQPDQARLVLEALMEAHPDLAIARPQLEAHMARPVISTPEQGLAEAYLTLAASLSQPQAVFLRTVFLRFALELRPDLSAARLILASTQINAADPSYTPSKVEMRNALATLTPIPPGDPLYAPAAVQEANLLNSLGEPDQAEALLDRLLATYPDDAGLLALAGDIRRTSGACRQALPYYQKAIAAVGEPPPPTAWPLFFDRGICEDETGNWAAAEPDIETALKLSPSQPYVLNYLAYSWALRDENLPQAQAMLTKAVALDPNDGAVLDSLGFVELKLGNTNKALALLIQAVQLSPDDPEVNAHLGDAFWQAGQPLQAAYQWGRALNLHPDAKLAAALREKLATHFGGPAS
ncbi:tetratricopeptide repeat protein [Acidocella sp.]|uniref:tetratricopeptide repeat protein n=1 Tax=Acidocella sp. TaxID=50710 RepID=UPI00261BC120|nr:tetratricopeptide repeat protein [Acidocella sp.]